MKNGICRRSYAEPGDLLLSRHLDLFGEWTHQEGVQNIRMQQADALDLDRQLPPEWAGYDLIVSSAMLEYIPKDRLGLVLDQLKRRLNVTGRLLLFVTRRIWTA